MKAFGIIKSAAIALVLGVCAATGTFAQEENTTLLRLDNALAALNLTDQQKAEVDRLREAFNAKYEGTINEIETLHETKATQQESGNTEGIAALNEQITAKEEALKQGIEEFVQQVMAVLTDAQKSQLMGTGEPKSEG